MCLGCKSKAAVMAMHEMQVPRLLCESSWSQVNGTTMAQKYKWTTILTCMQWMQAADRFENAPQLQQLTTVLRDIEDAESPQ